MGDNSTSTTHLEAIVARLRHSDVALSVPMAQRSRLQHSDGDECHNTTVLPCGTIAALSQPPSYADNCCDDTACGDIFAKSLKPEISTPHKCIVNMWNGGQNGIN